MLRRLTVPVALALLALVFVAPAWAGTITVTTTADSGPGSLRQALVGAAPGDTVAVPAGTFVLTSGVLSVPAGVTVRGAGARATTVSGNNASGVFTTAGAGVTIQDLKVTGGNAVSGGGVSSSYGLTLHRVAVVGNVASSDGGGVSSGGSQPLLIDHSLIANNQSAGTSGGVSAGSSGAGSAIVDTTIANNTASSAGGGLYLLGGDLLLDSDTLVGNVLTSGSGQGGNFRQHGANMHIRNTILAGGVATFGGDCYLAASVVLTSLGHNAEDTDATPDSDCQTALSATGDRKGLVLLLGLLQDNGGPTDTMRPAATSPLIDTGDAASCPATDQRGARRPFGAGCDVGAFERTAPGVGGAFADGITTTSAVLHASVDGAGLAGSARIAYGPTSAYGAFSALFSLGALTSAQGVTTTITGLQPATTYHFKLTASTADGSAAGADATFTTAKPAKVIRCKVPKLKGLSLTRAKRALKRAHCRLGRVHKPRHARGKLVVLRQAPKAGALRRNGTRVAVVLGKPPKRKHHR